MMKLEKTLFKFSKCFPYENDKEVERTIFLGLYPLCHSNFLNFRKYLRLGVSLKDSTQVIMIMVINITHHA